MYETNVLRRNRKKTGEKELAVARSTHNAKEIKKQMKFLRTAALLPKKFACPFAKIPGN